MRLDLARTTRGALAGALAAGVWAAVMPLDKRLVGSSFDDVELLGKAVTHGQSWPLVGWALHIQNGALFGIAYAHVAPRMPVPSWARGPLAATAENLLTWPLTALTDRLHPARDEMPSLFANPRALVQATWRHFLFGIVLGEVERRLDRQDQVEIPEYSHVTSSNGHGGASFQEVTSSN